MADLIDKNKVLKKFIKGDGDDEFTTGYNFAVDEYREKVSEIPAEPVRCGHWKFLARKNGYLWTCSACNGNFDNQYRYCPYCGAKMEG